MAAASLAERCTQQLQSLKSHRGLCVRSVQLGSRQHKNGDILEGDDTQ